MGQGETLSQNTAKPNKVSWRMTARVVLSSMSTCTHVQMHTPKEWQKQTSLSYSWFCVFVPTSRMHECTVPVEARRGHPIPWSCEQLDRDSGDSGPRSGRAASALSLGAWLQLRLLILQGRFHRGMTKGFQTSPLSDWERLFSRILECFYH